MEAGAKEEPDLVETTPGEIPVLPFSRSPLAGDPNDLATAELPKKQKPGDKAAGVFSKPTMPPEAPIIMKVTGEVAAVTPPPLPVEATPAPPAVQEAPVAPVIEAVPADVTKAEIEKIASSLPPKKTNNTVVEPPKSTKEIAVKSGVAGLVSKLEQQASKASLRLEAQVEEIQSRLTDEYNEMLSKVNFAENRNVRNAQDLCAEVTEHMDKAAQSVRERIVNAAKEGAEKITIDAKAGAAQLDEKEEYVRAALSSSFEEVRARADAVARDFEQKMTEMSTSQSAELDELIASLTEQLGGLSSHYEALLSETFDTFKQRLESTDTSIRTTVEARFTLFQGQLAELNKRWQAKVLQLRQSLIGQLSKQFTVAQADVRKLRASSLEESVLPRLRQHREELRVITTEFQQKLSDDLVRKGQDKLGDFEPLVNEKRQKLIELQDSTVAIKDAMEEQLRRQLQEISDKLKSFVESGVESAKDAYKTTEEKLRETDKVVRGLADQSSIEGDITMLNTRNELLNAMDSATERSREEVLGTLRANLAALEEKGKQLQEELICSMEEDAYRVRRASEQSLTAMREAIKDSFAAIQTAQDERMPM